MAQNYGHSRVNDQTVDDENAGQQMLQSDYLDVDYDRQLEQLRVLVKKAGCKFGEYD